ncbi:hypothetical protein [Cumulibacter manganitolerans]|uniref:hypothetical protein n=1 Tax=Cumulibacter manganitolerans TaxID=1884992 RepID=UPI0012952B49|nr:hypothetical protein [Cumulibacter manganitolerans]
MTPSNLPPQGRYHDPRIQQMVLDELQRKDIQPEKFYFTSDDWMVSYDGPTPAWNSVFGIAPYVKDGQTYYAECGVSQRYDPTTSQWGEPAATVKEGLPLSSADFDAAPGALGGTDRGAAAGGGQPGAAHAGQGGPDQGGPGQGVPGQGGVPGGSPDSSQTMLAQSVPAVGTAPGAAGPGGGSTRADAGDPWTTDSAQNVSEADVQPTDAQVPDGYSSTSTPRHALDEEERPSATEWEGDTAAGHGEDAETGHDRDAELPAVGGEAESRSFEAGPAEAQDAQAHGGSAVYGGDAINSSDSPYGSGRRASVAGYALTVGADGKAELRVPLGGQVTLKWDGQ